jgi:uncharacterized coiled-coil protein SlyX
VIGDLFSGKPEDIEMTLKSVFAMMKQRCADIDFRQEIRGKMNKQESTSKELSDQLKTQRQRFEQLQSDYKELENRMRNQEKKAKEDYSKLQTERNELITQLTKVQNKETQYRHDLRNRDLQIAKLQESVKQRVFV